MDISISEYWGQTVSETVGIPILLEMHYNSELQCPFSGLPCRMIASEDLHQPVCSIRVHKGSGHTLFHPICPDRLLPTYTNGIWPPHIAALASVAQTVFPGAGVGQIGFKRQVGISLQPGRLILDYVLQIDPRAKYTAGPSKVIIEVQGGGETSNTGTITRYVDDWINQPTPTNAFLSSPLSTSYLRQHLGLQRVNVPGIIPNNAWKRQLDQILKKAILAQNFQGAFALVSGEMLFDYIRRSIPVGVPYFPQWEVALIGISEVPSSQPGPLQFTHVSQAAFMTFADFIAALQNFNMPLGLASPFSGQYTTLTNSNFMVP